MARLLPLDEAQTRLLALAGPLAVETIAVADAAGRWAAQDIHARRAQPAVDLSAMDGYAIRHADLPGPFAVIGESAAGHGFSGAVGPGKAVRIFTGAAVPDGADTVVMQEDCARDGDVMRVTAPPPPPGRHIRRSGNDFADQALLVPGGERLTPAAIALAIMGGHGTVAVHRRARVALISTGDELVAPGDAAGPNQIPGSNGPMLAAMLRATGADVDDLGVIPDDIGKIRRAVEAARGHDVILTIGGASVGDLDLVRPALTEAGATLDFIKVALKPGKPLMAGRLGAAPVVGLPGNPVSAYVTAMLFALPLVRRRMGAARPLPPILLMPLGEDMPAVGGRTEFVRGKITGGRVSPLPGQDSAALATLTQADVLIRRDAHSPAAVAGTMVETLKLD